MKNIMILIMVLVLGFFLNSCIVRHGDFTVLSNKLIRTSGFELEKADRVKSIQGKDVQHILLFIPFGSAPTLEGALDDAFEKGGGDVMTDAVVKSYFVWIPFFYSQSAWVVKGDVVKTRIK